MEQLINSICDNDTQIISIVGLAKNTGKTTTINHIINMFTKKGINFGITSTGRDGEEFDVLTSSILKPAIYIPIGAYFATTSVFIENLKSKFQIIKETRFRTSMGKVFICKALGVCKVQIAGPTTNSGIKEVCDIMSSLGCKYIFVDGSINRLSVTSTKITNSIILTTGASVHEDMNEVINKTKEVVNRYRIEEIEYEIKKYIDNESFQKNKITIIYDDGKAQFINSKSTLLFSDRIPVKKKPKYVFVSGAVFEDDIKNIVKHRYLKDTVFVVEDGSKIFFNIRHYQEMGLKIKVINKTNILMITINPEYPTYYSFDKKLFLNKVKESFEDIVIYNLGCINVKS